MDIQDILRVLKNGAEKPKDDLNEYAKGKRDGLVIAYSHAWTLVKSLSLSVGSQCACSPDETTGTTTIPCCNVCGKPTEDWWCGV